MQPDHTEKRLLRSLWRYLLVVHRWLGIALSLVVFLWCLSGIVMMYVRYPAFDADERLAGLPVIDGGSAAGWRAPLDGLHVPAGDFAVESTPAGLVLRLAGGPRRTLLLESARWVERWGEAELAAFGHAYAAARGWSPATDSQTIERDQWTVHSRFNVHRPLLKLANGDGIEWYVSGSSGEVVQTTTRSERAWNWLGSVVHWIYPTALRRHVGAWTSTVIWLSALALFLTVTGIVIGIRQYRRGPGRRLSPYRGVHLWHHLAGLVFGMLTLTWLLSGLVSMNPGGAFESRSAAPERAVLNGGERSVGETVELLRSAALHLPAGTVRIESAFWLGAPFLVAYGSDGRATRIGPDGVVNGLTAADLQAVRSALGTTQATIDRVDAGDAYYYTHHELREYPVWRLVAANGDRYYLSAATGRLVEFVDAGARSYRWLFNALHSGDFHPAARSRPLWDVFMLILLVGVSAGAGTGVWLAYRGSARETGRAASAEANYLN